MYFTAIINDVVIGEEKGTVNLKQTTVAVFNVKFYRIHLRVFCSTA
jgi:hypothetical protein